MTPTKNQNEDFVQEVIQERNLLAPAIAWIKENLDPGDVFDESQLAEDVKNNLGVDDVFDDDDIKDYAKDSFEPQDVFDQDDIASAAKMLFTPQDVFDEDELREWAENHGMAYV